MSGIIQISDNEAFRRFRQRQLPESGPYITLNESQSDSFNNQILERIRAQELPTEFLQGKEIQLSFWYLQQFITPNGGGSYSQPVNVRGFVMRVELYEEGSFCGIRLQIHCESDSYEVSAVRISPFGKVEALVQSNWQQAMIQVKEVKQSESRCCRKARY